MKVTLLIISATILFTTQGFALAVRSREMLKSVGENTTLTNFPIMLVNVVVDTL